MWAILRVWTLINIPDNVITADTGTGGDTRVKVCFTLSRSRLATRIWVWSISWGPWDQTQTPELANCLDMRTLRWIITGITDPITSNNPGNTTFMRDGEPRLMRPEAMLLTDTQIWSWEGDRQGLRQSKLKSQNWNHHYWKYAWAWEWQPVS